MGIIQKANSSPWIEGYTKHMIFHLYLCKNLSFQTLQFDTNFHNQQNFFISLWEVLIKNAKLYKTMQNANTAERFKYRFWSLSIGRSEGFFFFFFFGNNMSMRQL